MGGKEGTMNRVWKTLLLIAVFILLAMGMSQAWGAPQNEKTPVFTANERELINEYYKHLLGTLAPASLDRAGFTFEIDRVLVTGSHVPLQLEKKLEPLPDKLESQLSLITGAYRRFKLGNHVVLIRRADLAIADIVKNAGMK